MSDNEQAELKAGHPPASEYKLINACTHNE